MSRRPLIVPLLLTALAAGTADARTVEPLPPQWQKGVNVAAFRWDGFSGDRFYYWMRQLRHRAHAETAMFSFRWFQYWDDRLRSDDQSATDINPSFGSRKRCRGHPRDDYTRCQTPSLRALRKAIEYAKALGLRIALKPLVDVGRNPGSRYDRDQVNFSEPEARDRWFESYRAMLGRYAALARDVDADLLVIGTGLTNMSDGETEQLEWRRMIQDIRTGDLMPDGAGGFTGDLTYAARWDALASDAYDAAFPEFFWDELDLIGVEGFWPLIGAEDPEHDNPAVRRLRHGWSQNFIAGGLPPGAALRALHREYRKPVVLTGLGYLSRGGTAAEPSKSDEAQAAAGGEVNQQAQRRPYRAAFDFWGAVARRERWFRGIYWWNWLPKIGDSSNGDFTPQGKDAETELCLRHLGRNAVRRCRPSGMPS